MADLREKLKKKANSLPDKPGCYLMKRKDSEVIYVGKAKNLKKRVGSYFLQSKKDPKTEILIKHITNFDFMVTKNEAEALILENNLIKEHRPKYNIRLKDDKSYPYIVVDYSHRYPKIEYKRNIRRKKKQIIFGPFVTGSNILEIVKILRKALKIRDCSDYEFKGRKRPCIMYQMKWCHAPCTEKIDPSFYAELLDTALDLFRGSGRKLKKYLESEMNKYARNEEFEMAAMMRDYLLKIDEFIKQNQAKNVEIYGKKKDVDIISYVKGDKETDIVIHLVRNNLLLGTKGFHFANKLLNEADDLESHILSFIYQYYAKVIEPLPEMIIFSFLHTELKSFQEAITKLSEDEIEVSGPNAKFMPLIRLSTEQARENQKLRLSGADDIYHGLTKLGELLELNEMPRVLECYDVAIWQGKSPTASQVVFHDGRPDKSMYRFYELKERPEGNNDFAMMKELIERRIHHKNYPDVFIVDGGQGQIKQFKEILKKYKIDLPVIGIAKKRGNEGSTSYERLVIPGRKNHFMLSKSRELMKIIVSMRDEAHRFSRVLHHKHEKKRVMQSFFDDVPRIGPKTKETILKNLDMPIENLRNLSVVQLMDYLKVNNKVAKNILKKLI